jgi:hypothetical protein
MGWVGNVESATSQDGDSARWGLCGDESASNVETPARGEHGTIIAGRELYEASRAANLP